MTVTRSLENCIGAASPSGGGSAPVIDELNVTPSTSAQEITAPEGTDGFSPVKVSAVTASIDANIVAGNIKKDVQILGVTGTLESSPIKTWYNWQNKIESTNYTKVGTPTITDGILSIPTDNSGTMIKATNTLPSLNNINKIEIVCKLKRDEYESSVSEEIAEFWASSDTMNYMSSRGMSLWINSNGAITWNMSGNVTNCVTNAVANTWYYVKIIMTPSNGSYLWTTYYSTDGETWITSLSGERPQFYDSYTNILFGAHLGTKTSTTDIDLNECYIKVNDILVWQPYSETINGQVYTLTETPDTSSIVYDNTSTQSALTITSVGTGTITCSDTKTYTRNSAGDTSALNVTANGTYDVTEYAQVIVNVS